MRCRQQLSVQGKVEVSALRQLQRRTYSAANRPRHGYVLNPMRLAGSCMRASDRSLSMTPATVTVLTSSSNGKGPVPKGLADSPLPPRPLKRNKPAGSGGGSSGGGTGGGGGGGGRKPVDRKLAALWVYSGLVGTTAIVLANLTGIDLWGAFDWNEVDDLKLAAAASVPLQILNCAILLPSYSSGRLPDSLKADALLQHTPGSASAASTSASSETRPPAEGNAAVTPLSATTVTSVQETGSGSGTSAASSLVAEAASEADTSATVPPTPSTSTAPQQSASEAAMASGTHPPEASSPPSASGSPQPASPPPPPAGFLPASSWGSSPSGRDGGGATGSGKPGAQLELTDVRSALHLAQGYYISNNPTAKLSPLAEVLSTSIDSAAGEMLYRGVALTWLAGWLKDRVTEAGIEEAILEQLPVAAATIGGARAQDVAVELGLYGSCECAIAAGTAAFVVWSVMARSRRAVRQLEMVLAGVTAASAQRANGDSSKTGGAGKAPGDARLRQTPPQLMLGPGSPTVSAAGAGAVMQRAAAIQAVRDATQVLLLNGIFIATGGNLAASFSAALANQFIISVLQRRGVKRMQDRSAALAKELRAYNAQLQKIAAKHKDKLPKDASAELEKMAAADAAEATTATTTTATSSSSDVPAAAAAAGSRGDSVASSTMASVASPDGGPSEALAETGSGQAEVNPTPHNDLGSNGVGSAAARRSSLENALSMLDQLIPEPPKPVKTAPGRPKAPDQGR